MTNLLQTWMTPWLLVAVPCLGATLSLLLRASLDRMKTCALTTTAASLFTTAGLSWTMNDRPAGMLFLSLLPLASFLSLLGQPLHQDNRDAWPTTLLLLGLGLGILSAEEPARIVLLVTLLGLLCGMIYRYQNAGLLASWRGLAAYGLGIVSTLLTLALPAPASTVAALVTCATLLPLLPVHGGFVAVLTGLPGNLPAFLVFLLPALGFHSLVLLLPNLTGTMFHTLALLALAGAGYGSLRALIQSRPLPRLAYASLALFSVLWWYVANTGTAPVQAFIYLSAVGLAMSGLLLAWYAIRARYGEIDLRALGGLAYPMPRFSTLLTLLALAALGMPPFGVFAGFLGMLLNPAFAPDGPFAVIMLVWLSSSWYLIELVQQVVFGRHRPDLRYEDLRRTEFASLVLLLLLLLVLGTAPSRLFESNAVTPPSSVAMKGAGWIP
ncbi:MAG: NADH-ubiquinone oxidoreductase chain M [Nitrospira sp.]|jgi:NADH-quinone oxidoreductase subunit M|nr:MAG: NADH-ubiquinone oxidoreductase chain M [Nitrospira sp.]